MDFAELDPSESGKKYTLVFQDYLTKWPEVYAVADRKAETVVQCLKDLIWHHGVPNRIIHDRVPEFSLQEAVHLMEITQLPTSGGYPQANGLVERFNRTLKQMLAKVVQYLQKDEIGIKCLGLFYLLTGVLHTNQQVKHHFI